MRARSRPASTLSDGRNSRPPTAPACGSAPPAGRPCGSTWPSAAVVRRSSSGSVMRSKVIASTLIACLWLIAGMRGAAPRFYPDDPLMVDNDRVVEVTTAGKIDLDDYYDFLENSFGTPGDRSNVPAVNVNTL